MNIETTQVICLNSMHVSSCTSLELWRQETTKWDWKFMHNHIIICSLIFHQISYVRMSIHVPFRLNYGMKILQPYEYKFYDGIEWCHTVIPCLLLGLLEKLVLGCWMHVTCSFMKHNFVTWIYMYMMHVMWQAHDAYTWSMALWFWVYHDMQISDMIVVSHIQWIIIMNTRMLGLSKPYVPYLSLYEGVLYACFKWQSSRQWLNLGGSQVHLGEKRWSHRELPI